MIDYADSAFLSYLTALNTALAKESIPLDTVSISVEQGWILIECQGLKTWRLVAKLHEQHSLMPYWGLRIWESGELALSLNQLGKWDFSPLQTH